MNLAEKGGGGLFIKPIFRKVFTLSLLAKRHRAKTIFAYAPFYSRLENAQLCSVW